MKDIVNGMRKLGVGVAAALVVLIGSAGVAAAQEAPPGDKSESVSKVVRKGKAPVSKEVLKVKLPKPFEAKLPNGLTVLILENHRLPTVAASLQIRGAGGMYDPADKPGVASLTAQMMREGGTAKMDGRKLAEAVDQMGATINAGSGFNSESATLTAGGLSENFDEWFPLALEVLLEPAFPADALARLKPRQLAGLRAQRTNPGFLSNERFNKALYGTHPAAVISATEASLQAMTVEDLKKWHAERFVPQTAILAISGDVTPSDLMPKLTKWFANWKKTDLSPSVPATPTASAARKIHLVDRPASVQTTLLMGNLAIDRRDADYIPLVVLNRVLGQGASARLFLNLREEKGYTYGVYSNLNALAYVSPWTAGGDVRTEVTDGAMKEFLYELKRIGDEPVPAAELEDAKRAIVARFALDLESPQTLVNYAILQKIYGFPADYWETYPAKISAVTAADVQRVAKKYYNPDRMQVVAVGDASKIKGALEKYGTVEAYDADGKPVAQKAATATPSGN